MRLDRWLTLWLFRGLARPQPNRIPVLMYHRISDDAELGIKPYYRVTTSPRQFAAQMDWLAAGGYRGVSLAVALDSLAKGNAPQEPLVAITFDDGFRDFHTQAWPALQKHGFSATMYLPTAFISDSRCSFKNCECLTWTEVRELHSCGIHFGSHTVNHPVLYHCGWPEIDQELCASKAVLEDRLQCAAPAFAYPYAYPQQDREFANRFTERLVAAGYQSAVTTAIGRVAASDDLFRIKRLPVNSGDDRAFFVAKLAGAYDWVAGIQSLVKSFKGFRNSTLRPT